MKNREMIHYWIGTEPKRENIRCSLATAMEIAKHDEINCIYFSLSKEKWELLAMLSDKQRADIDFVHIIDTPGLNGVYGLLGVNGAGKTTLMRMICTLLPPTSGRILCDGKDIFKMDGEYRNLLGYLPQEFGFYPDFTVKDYLLYIASLKGIRPMVAGKRVKELLAQVGLTKSANKKMRKLSGGMKRRAGIAQAMLNNPKILILDEPTAGLDPTERVRFRNLISELSEDRIVILSTHIVSDVEYIANEIWLMKDGQIMQQGNLDQTLASMQEKVYACEVSQADATKMMKKFKVSNMKAESGMVNLRIIASEPPIAGASVVEPTLEDVFLYYFGEKGGEME